MAIEIDRSPHIDKSVASTPEFCSFVYTPVRVHLCFASAPVALIFHLFDNLRAQNIDSVCSAKHPEYIEFFCLVIYHGQILPVSHFFGTKIISVSITFY